MRDDFWKKLGEHRPRREGRVEHSCPRRGEGPGVGTGPDVWGPDDCCSYCGSLDPDVFMARIEAGDVRLTPTDKSYKVYVGNDGGAPLRQTYRPSQPSNPDAMGDDPSKWVWETREMSTGKFYFQHLSPTQRTRFIELLNDKRLKLEYPGYFYRLPFFCRVADEEVQT